MIDSEVDLRGIFLTEKYRNRAWIFKDNAIIICNYIMKDFDVLLSTQFVITFMKKNALPGEDLIDASERIKRLVRAKDEETLIKLKVIKHRKV